MLIGRLNSPRPNVMDFHIRLLIAFGDLIHLFYVFPSRPSARIVPSVVRACKPLQELVH